jgi:hypothetical protein
MTPVLCGICSTILIHLAKHEGCEHRHKPASASEGGRTALCCAEGSAVHQEVAVRRRINRLDPERQLMQRTHSPEHRRLVGLLGCGCFGHRREYIPERDESCNRKPIGMSRNWALEMEIATLNPGLYGLTLPDLRLAHHLLVPAPPHWRPWKIVRRRGETERVDASIGRDSARLRVTPEGSLVMDRTSRTSVLTMPRLPSDEELAHPYLAATAAIAARWQGWQSFHAGGFAVGGRVWGVLGDREVGKSTLLAVLARLGVLVVSDDVLVVRDGNVMAGPRCLDLRERPAAELGLGQNIGIVGNRRRWRFRLAAVDPELPMAGWVTLSWGTDMAIEPVAPAERFLQLLDNLTVVLEPPDPPAVLALASLPMVTLHRPRRLDALCAGAELLLSHLQGS